MSRGDVDDAVAKAYREEWSAVLATMVRLTRDFDLAEDCTQDAFATALTRWEADGVPSRPGAWLTTVARNRALDAMRRRARDARALPLLAIDAPGRNRHDPQAGGLDDDLLRLIFVCCHPALDRPSRIALTLRLVCGLTTADVARAYVVKEATMAARITRAKKKIALARIPFRVPDENELTERIDAVLDVVHLIFTTAHTAPSGRTLLREDLADTSIRLARLLHALIPRDPQVTGLLALLLLTDARRSSRVSPEHGAVLLDAQDRRTWNTAMIGEGLGLVERSLRDRPTRYGIQAAIAAVHAHAATWESTDWEEIVALYDQLAAHWPSPVVELNRAVAIGFRDGPQAGLDALTPLLTAPIADVYPYVAAAEADLLRRLGRLDEAGRAYSEALELTRNEAERALLRHRLDELQSARDTRPG